MFKLNRDTLGRFVPQNIILAKIALGSVVLAILLYGVSEVVIAAANWSRLHWFQRPIVVLIDQNDTFFEIKKWRGFVYDREPVQVLSPLARELLAPKPEDNLTPIEKKIVDKFGPKYGYIAMAVFRCESGLDRYNVGPTSDLGTAQIHWPTHRKLAMDRFGWTFADMADEDKNLTMAHLIWDRADGEEGNGEGSFSPWVVYQTGAWEGCL